MEAPNDDVAEERPPDSPSPPPSSKRVIPAQRYRKGDPLPEGVSGAPNERKLVELMEKTGCMISQTNGQRRFGPPPDWPPDEPPPPRGCEVFIGKIPRDLYEDELVPVLQMIGRLYELRLMMDFSGNNRGYAFAVFSSRDEAKQCVRALDNYEIRRGRSLGVCISVDNCRLFIGGIPKKVTKADILDEMRRLTDGVVDAIVYASVADKTKNRGFAFVEYDNHRAAAMARRKLMRQRLVVWGTEIAVDWAEPEQVIDEDVMAKVKVLYVRNLMVSTTEEQIHQKFVEFGKLEKVKKIRDYAFVHYSTRDDAVAAKESMDGEEFDGSLLAISWAKPVDKEQRQLAKNFGKTFYDGVAMYPTVNDVSGGGSGGEMVPRSPTSTQAVVPPVNSIYPLQISPFFRRTERTHLGSYVDRIPSSGNTRPAQSCRRYALPPTTLSLSPGAKPFFPPPPPQGSPPAIPPPPPHSSPFGTSPVMIHALVADPVTSSGVYMKKHSVEVLEDICTKSNWGSPQYHLIQLNCNSGMTPFYIQKVSIPGLGQHQFQSTKLCSSADEAKTLAAENALYHLGLSFLPEGFALSLPAPNFSSHISSISASVNDPTKPPPPPPLPGAIPPPGGVWQPIANLHEIAAVYGSPPPPPPPPPPLFNGFHANRSIYSPSEVYPY